MQEIDDICKKNEVDYYLFGGTLIGAMRHKGFIPWDDDVDIIMSRDNWAKFLEACKKELPENRVLSSQDLNPDIAMPVHHYVDTTGTTLYRYHITNPEVSGLMIDIQVMDPVPKSETDRANYIDDVLDLQDFTNGTYYVALRNPVHGGQASHIAKYRKMSRRLGKRAVIDEIGKRSFHHTVEESAYYAQRYGGAPIFYPIEAFGKPQYVPFENIMLPVPERAADVLTIAYGDWWMIPRSGSTKSTHEFAVRSFSTPSDVFFNEFHSVTSKKKIDKIAWKKKLFQEKYTKERFVSAINVDSFLQQKVCMDYEKPSKQLDVLKALEESRYDELREYFSEYVAAQCNEHYTGSPSINGWKRFYRRNAPLLIDIGDDRLSAAILLMIRDNRINSATKIVHARQSIDREFCEELKRAFAVYEGTMQAISYDACGESEKCFAITGTLLEQFGDNPYLFVLSMKQKIMDGMSYDDVIQTASEGLKRFPNNDDLLYFKAEALMQVGKREEAFDIYQQLSQTSNHGIVLTALKDKLAILKEDDPDAQRVWMQTRYQLGEEPEDGTDAVAGGSEDGNFIKDLTDVQKIKRDLLFELDDICRSEGISYMLVSDALYQAVQYKKYVFPESEIVVGMTVPDVLRFSEAVRKNNRKDRFLCSMENNPDYPVINVLYGNENTCDFDINRFGEKIQQGISITIHVIRTEYKNKLLRVVDEVLEKGWQNQYSFKNAAFFEHKSDYIINFLRFFKGKKLGRSLYRRFMKNGWRENTTRLFVRPYKKDPSYFSASLYDNFTEVDFEGRKIMAPSNPQKFLKITEDDMDKRAERLRTMERNIHNRIVDPNTSYAEYEEYLKAHGINKEEIWRYNIEANAKYAKVLVLDRKLTKYWNLLCSIGYHFNLAEKYIPMKEELKKLLEKKDIATLTKLMAEYDMAYCDKKITQSYLEFDPEITEIYLQLQKLQNN